MPTGMVSKVFVANTVCVITQTIATGANLGAIQVITRTAMPWLRN